MAKKLKLAVAGLSADEQFAAVANDPRFLSDRNSQVTEQHTFDAPASIDGMTTQLIYNNIGYLDDLRRQLERTNRKSIYDVRDFGDTMASSVLAGVEGRIGYVGLVNLIDDMRAGVARRVALAA